MFQHVYERIILLLEFDLHGEMQHRVGKNRGNHKAVRRKEKQGPRGQKLMIEERGALIDCSLTFSPY